SVNALGHFTSWVVGHVHSGALGWVGMMSFGMLYWLVPRLWNRELYSQKLASTHFWTATIGIVLYTVSMWGAGLTEGLMWRAVDEGGRLRYPAFLDIVQQLEPFYWARVLGGALYLIGALLFAYNLARTIKPAVGTQQVPAVAAK